MGQTVIEINGKKYDASTGGIVNRGPSLNIDGINRAPTQNLVPAAKPTPPASRPARLMHDITTSKRHKQQKAHTLMRHVVKKPGASNQRHAPATPAAHPFSNSSYISTLHNSERLDRALTTPSHPAVSRYVAAKTNSVQAVVQHMPVAVAQTPPLLHSTQQHTKPAQTYRTPSANSFVESQLAKAVPADNRPSKGKLRKRLNNKGVNKSKLLSVAAGLASAVMIVGFMVNQNLPSVSLALANKNAGISMSVPNGIPSNFQMSNNIDYAPGLITLSFKSQNDKREFTITQQKITEGTQESLEKAIAISAKGNYQTYQTNGLKLFMVDVGEADWIDGNMRYSVSGESGLSSEQLATIAASL